METVSKFMNSEYVYLGQWHSDMKHGQGKLMRSNQEPIYGSFANDKLNGLATQGYRGLLRITQDCSGRRNDAFQRWYED